MPPEKKWKGRSLSSRGSTSKGGSSSLQSQDDLYTFALQALGRRAHSTSELRQKLLDRCRDLARVNSLLQVLTERGYLNDRDYIERLVTSRYKSKLYSRSRIQQELEYRNLSPQLIEDLLGSLCPSDEERARLAWALDKKLRTLRAPFDAKKLSKLYNYLHRLGFPAEAIRQELRERFEGYELDDEGV